MLILSYNETQAVQLLQAVSAWHGQIEPRGLDRRMTKQIGEACDVVVVHIEFSGKEMAQIVGKDFSRRYAAAFCQFLHGGPDFEARQIFSTGGDKDCTAGDFFART